MSKVILNASTTYWFCSVDSSRFYFSEYGGRDKAEMAAQKHAAAVVAAIENHLGRPMTADEIYAGGVEHDEPDEPVLTPQERRAKTAAEVTEAAAAPKPSFQDGADVNPAAFAREHGLDKAKQKFSRARYYADLGKQHEQEQARKAEAEAIQAAKAGDVRRQKAIAHASAELLAIRYDKSASKSQLLDAEHRLALAKDGDLDEFSRQSREHAQAKSAKLSEKEAELSAAIADLQAKKKALSSSTFEMPEPEPAPAPVPSHGIEVVQMPFRVLEEQMQKTREMDAARRQ